MRRQLKAVFETSLKQLKFIKSEYIDFGVMKIFLSLVKSVVELYINRASDRSLHYPSQDRIRKMCSILKVSITVGTAFKYTEGKP